MGNSDEFIRAVQKRTALCAIGASSVRGYPKGTVNTIHEFLAELPIEQLMARSRAEFTASLDRQTSTLASRLAKHGGKQVKKARFWGLSRKALNMFLRDVLYSYYLRKRFGAARVERFLEVPLDRHVLHALGAMTRQSKGGSITRKVQSLQDLTPQSSRALQKKASVLQVGGAGLALVHKDLFIGPASKKLLP